MAKGRGQQLRRLPFVFYGIITDSGRMKGGNTSQHLVDSLPLKTQQIVVFCVLFHKMFTDITVDFSIYG